jgi:hypothetical protein
LAGIARFNTSGKIDARNGGAYAAATSVAYSAGVSYHFRLVVNVAAHTYSIYVTPAGGTENTIGTNYAFRTEQNGVTNLADWSAYVDSASSGSLMACNFVLGSAADFTISATPSSQTVVAGSGTTYTATVAPLNGFTGALNGIVRFNVGRDFNVVTVSFDPRDTAQNAADTKKRYMQRYRRAGAEQGWHFLTGRKDQIDALAAAVGFRYAWDPEIQQYAHASGVMLLTPSGKVAQYYYGIEYVPRDIQLGLVEASKGKIGNLVDEVLLYCYHYDPTKAKYGAAIFNILRLGALATVLVLGGFMLMMFRRDSLAARQGRLLGQPNR